MRKDVSSLATPLTYWRDTVQMEEQQEQSSSSNSSPSSILLQVKVHPEELRRMISEWLLLPPCTKLQFQADGVQVDSGHLQHACSSRFVPHSQEVFE